MRYLGPLGLLACGIAVAVGLAVSNNSADVRSPLDVVGAFAYQLDKGNFGKACGLYAQDVRGPDVESCSQGFVFTAGQNMMFFGVDPFDGAHVVPASEVIVDDDTHTYMLKTSVLPPVKVTVELQENGRWRITKVG